MIDGSRKMHSRATCCQHGLFAIRGYEFDFGEELSYKAKEDFYMAMDFLDNFLNE